MRDLTQGSITKTIIAMALPVAAGMLFQTMYLLVDLYFVAALGDDAVAGVGAAGTLMFMIMAVTQVLGVSSVALISQAVGSKQQDQAKEVERYCEAHQLLRRQARDKPHDGQCHTHVA